MTIKTIDDLLKSDMGTVAEWLIENCDKFALVPREPTIQMRHAFHESMQEFEDGIQEEGCPDDQWKSMIDTYENRC